MIAPRIALLVAALVLTASVDLPGQQEPPVAPGDRVRVIVRTIDDSDLYLLTPGTAVRRRRRSSSHRLVGTLVAVSADTVVLEVEGRADPLALPLASVTSLEVSRGQKSRVGKGALIGGVVGAVIGGVLGAVSIGICQSPDNTHFVPCWLNIPIVAGLGGAVGAGVGAGIGAASGPADRWETVPLDRISVSLRPRGGGLEVSAKFVF